MTQTAWMKPLMWYAMPFVMAVAMFFLPVALHFSFLATLSFGIVQTLIIRNKSFRKRFDLAPIIEHTPAGPKDIYGVPLNISPTFRAPTAEELLKAEISRNDHKMINKAMKPFKEGWQDAKQKIGSTMNQAQAQRDKGSPKNRRRSKVYMENAEAHEKRRTAEIKNEKASRYL